MRTVTLQGKSFHLEGNLPKIGQHIPDCTLVNAELKPVQLSSFQGKKLVLVTVPSLDTPVCQKETRHFHELLSKKKNLQLVVISMDLPFAQKRWCGAEGLELSVLSDFKDHQFGKLFGVRIQELGLLARTVFLVKEDGTLLHVEVVPVLSDEPNYQDILAKLA